MHNSDRTVPNDDDDDDDDDEDEIIVYHCISTVIMATPVMSG